MNQPITIVSDYDKIEEAKHIFQLMSRNNLKETYYAETGAIFSRKILKSKTVLAEKRSGQKGIYIYNQYKF